MTANPQLHGIILDLPDVVPSATSAAAALGLAERSRVLGGDFFASVPDADLYLLKHILHDWDDGQAVRILENCRRAMRSGGRVIVVEWLLGEVGESGFAPFSDLNMMVMLTGRERTLSEYRALLKQAGFRLDKSSPIRSSMAVIEAVAASYPGHESLLPIPIEGWLVSCASLTLLQPPRRTSRPNFPKPALPCQRTKLAGARDHIVEHDVSRARFQWMKHADLFDLSYLPDSDAVAYRAR
jgi:hypothetical protein